MRPLSEELGRSLAMAADEWSGRMKTWTCTSCGETCDVPQSYESDSGVCSLCERRAARRENWIENLVSAQVPERYLSVPSTLNVDKRVARWAAETPTWSLVLLGPNGVGKTWSATWTLGELLARGVDLKRGEERVPIGARVLWSDVAWSIETMRQQIESARPTEHFDRLVFARVLLLDDWASMRDTEYGRERMRLVVKARYDQLRPTIITTDRPLKEIEPRLASRLSEKSGQFDPLVVLKGADRRRS